MNYLRIIKRQSTQVSKRNQFVSLVQARSDETELTLFRIVQEALTNAAKHSGGRSVHVAVEMAPWSKFGRKLEEVASSGCLRGMGAKLVS